jgi:predicted component of type VI protein secretion system
MEAAELRTLSDRLRLDLADGALMDPEKRALLLQIQREIEELLDHPPSAAGQQQDLRTRLQTAAVGIEASHPQLASMFEQACNVLSNLGL